MAKKVKVPELGESLVEATVGHWHKQEGDAVAIGDLLVDLETDKVDVEVGAESAGVLVTIQRQSGEDVKVGDVLAEIDPDGAGPAEEPSAEKEEEEEKTEDRGAAESKVAESPTAVDDLDEDKVLASPVAQRLAEEKEISLDQIDGTGPNGRITRQDVERHLRQRQTALQDAPPAKEEKKPAERPAESERPADRREERIRLSRRRRTIARRLIEAQDTAAILTTFNDVDMSAVIALRKRRGESFRERFGVKLGFMSFFVKGTIAALRAFPRLNAAIDGDEMVLKHYYDIGIAVGAEEGLVVPVIRDADRLSFAKVEQEIDDLAQKAQQGTLSIEEIRGGTFTISNGGIFGSLLSTPILNPPQVGILGLHRIEERPVAVEGEVVIRPMMYLALSYDHRLIDGREAVQFLGRLKELIEDPETLLLEG